MRKCILSLAKYEGLRPFPTISSKSGLFLQPVEITSSLSNMETAFGGPTIEVPLGTLFGKQKLESVSMMVFHFMRAHGTEKVNANASVYRIDKNM